MTIERKPSPVFAVLWLLWSFALFGSVLTDDVPRIWLFAAFFVLEGSAVLIKSGMRDTLSEIWTWVMRHLAKPTSGFARGWNAMVLAYILVISYAIGDSLVSAGMPGWVATVIGGLVTIFLYDHWTDPVRHG